jgi:Bacterial mobilisation protein (MobC)
LLRQIQAQQGKRGSNLNQIAHHLNSCDFRELAEEVVAMRSDLEAALREHRHVWKPSRERSGSSVADHHQRP